MTEDVTLGEVRRQVEQVRQDLVTAHQRIDKVQSDFVRKDVNEQVIGSFRVDFGRIDHSMEALDKALEVLTTRHDADIKALKDKADERFRQMVTSLVVAFVAPIITAIVVFYLTQGGK
jgi:hypothetical protein